MPVENAFFLKELRALGRRQFAPVAWPLLLQTVLLIFPLLMMERLVGAELEDLRARQGLALALLGLAHAIVTGSAGWAMGSRVLLEEHRQNTLESLLLVSVSPWRWLPRKLVFPLHGLTVVWLAALPSYAALVLRGHFTPGDLAPGLILSGAAGLVSFGAALLQPPQGLRSRLSQRVSVPDLVSDLSHVGLPYWIGLILLRLGWDWLMAVAGGGGAAFRESPFFWAVLRSDVALAALLLVFTIAALGSAFAAAYPASAAAERLRWWSRLLAIGAAYYLFVGYTWPGSRPIFRIAALAGPPVLLLARPLLSRSRRAGRREDRGAAREIRWLAGLTDNPVFLRDLRVALRPAGLTRQALMNALGLVLGVALVGGLSLVPFAGFMAGSWGSRGPWQQILAQVVGVTLLIGFWVAVPALLTYGSRSLAHWQAERRQDTLGQLFSSPLSTEQLVRGRWGAALLVGCARNMPVVIAFTLALFATGQWPAVRVCLALGLWLASMGLVLSAGFSGAAAQITNTRELGSAVCLAIYVLLAEGLGLAWTLSNLPQFVASGIQFIMLSYTLLLTPVNVLLTWLVYRRALMDVEYLRRRDLE
jgi:hypothetical protein